MESLTTKRPRPRREPTPQREARPSFEVVDIYRNACCNGHDARRIRFQPLRGADGAPHQEAAKPPNAMKTDLGEMARSTPQAAQAMETNAPHEPEDETPYVLEDDEPDVFAEDAPIAPRSDGEAFIWTSLAASIVVLVFALWWNTSLWESMTWGVAAPIVLVVGAAAIAVGVVGRNRMISAGRAPIDAWPAWVGILLGSVAVLLSILFFVVGIKGSPLF